MSLSALVGQPLVKELFRRAVGKGTVGHAYLFTGPKGLGKTSCARNLGKALNCQSPTAEGDACDACASCQAIDAGRDDAYRLIEADGGKIKITETRDLVAGMALRPDDGRRKVYVVREADRLTPSAAQNLLKVLEEPPEYGLIILTTDNPSSLPPTILSRCQQVPFRPAPVDEVTRVLAATTGRPESEVAQAAVMSGGNLG
ncbi:MAG TPA: DNA polymerase III subunit, partial [Bacillota bacterium]